MRYLIVILTLAALLVLPACKARQQDAPRYQTVTPQAAGDPVAARHHNARGIEHLEAGELDDAALAFREALTADVTSAAAHNNLGKVYYLQHDYYRAAWEFEYAISLAPDLPEPKNNLAIVLEAVGRLDDAVTHYQNALTLIPDNAEVMGNLARARLRRGDPPQQVHALLTRLVEIETRPTWREWASNMLALHSSPD